ncbi:MAG: hypothetical protein Q7V57_01760 [Actinomycetota bacterium]|nr:hypothetical protein [Actinomycetota bacterium]
MNKRTWSGGVCLVLSTSMLTLGCTDGGEREQIEAGVYVGEFVEPPFDAESSVRKISWALTLTATGDEWCISDVKLGEQVVPDKSDELCWSAASTATPTAQTVAQLDGGTLIVVLAPNYEVLGVELGSSSTSSEVLTSEDGPVIAILKVGDSTGASITVREPGNGDLTIPL